MFIHVYVCAVAPYARARVCLFWQMMSCRGLGSTQACSLHVVYMYMYMRQRGSRARARQRNASKTDGV